MKDCTFIKGDYTLGYRCCNKGYFLVARQIFKSGKIFDHVLCWVDTLPIEIIKEFKKGEN